MEAVQDFEHNGSKVLASRLGYRITDRFVHGFMGKIFDNPNAVFTEEILRPESQDLDVFVDGVNNIVAAQQRVAQQYMDDGSIEDACPPLLVLLHIMARGEYEGMDAHHPDIRTMFSREYLLASDWYKERLEIRQQREIDLCLRHIDNLEQFLALPGYQDEAVRLQIPERLQSARLKLQKVRQAAYLDTLTGTIGADPLRPYRVSDRADSVSRRAA